MQQVKILLTGANGFVGLHLFQALTQEGYSVIPLVQRSCDLANEIIIDFNDHDDFIGRLNKISSVDVVLHFAAKVDFTVTKEELFVPNVLATAELVKWAKEKRSYFIFASSIAVLGAKTKFINASTPENPDTPYGYSKWLAEKIIQISGVPYLILRFSGIYGENGPSHLGINRAINDAINGCAPTLVGDGKAKRNYVYVGDIARVVEAVIKKRTTGIHLLGGPEPISIKEMLESICAVFLSDHDLSRVEPDKMVPDQIVESSPKLPKGRNFIETIRGMKQ